MDLPEELIDSFDLLNLPHLVVEKVVKCMHIRDVLSYAGISNRTKEIVTQLKFPLERFDVIFAAENRFTVAMDNLTSSKHTFRIDRRVEEAGEDILSMFFRAKVTGVVFSDELHDIPSLCQWAPVLEATTVYTNKSELSLEEARFLFTQFNPQFFCSDSPLPQGLETVRMRSRILMVNDGMALKKESLLTMDCENVVIRQSSFTSADVVEFVKDWQNGGNPRLKMIMVYETQIGDDVVEFFDGKRWDPSVRGRNYYTGGGEWGEQAWGGVVDLAAELDVERNDGLLATIVARERRQFALFVWWDRFPTNYPERLYE